MRSIYTPREEVLLNQLTQTGGGLKPDRTTSQPAPAAAPAKPVQAAAQAQPKKSYMDGYGAYVRRQLPTAAAAVDYAADTPRRMAVNKAREIATLVGPKNYNDTQIVPNASERIGTWKGNEFISDARRERMQAAALPGSRGPETRPVIARQLPTAAPAAAPAQTVAGSRPLVRAGDPMVNSFGNRVGPETGAPADAPAPIPAQTQQAPGYAVSGYSGPNIGQPRAANIAGGLPRDEIIRRMRGVVGDSAFKGSPSARREMLAAYGAMLGAQDNAELVREKGGMDLQQAGVEGQVQGALELQRGLTRRGETAFAQEGAEKLETMRQDAPEEIVDADGNTLLRRGLKAEAVLDANGKPVRQTPKGAQTTNQRLDALLRLRELDAQSRLPGEPAPTNDPVSAAINEELGITQQATAAPDFNAWAAAAKKKYPNATPEEIKSGYDSLYGAK